MEPQIEILREWSDRFQVWRLIKRDGIPVVQYRWKTGKKFNDMRVGDAAIQWLADEISKVRNGR